MSKESTKNDQKKKQERPKVKVSPFTTPLKRKHQLVLKAMVELGMNQGEAMKYAGYSKSIQMVPSKVTKTKSFLEVCNENGLTDDRLTAFLNEDIEAKKGNRKGELELAFRIKGRLQPDIQVNNTQNLGVVYLPGMGNDVPGVGEDLD